MKKIFKSVLALLLLQAVGAYAFDQPITIDKLSPTEFTADDYHPAPGTTLNITGAGFFPHAKYQDERNTNNDVQHSVQVLYRQVYPTLGNFQTVNFGEKDGDRGNLWVSELGPNYMRVEIKDLVRSKNANTAWSFSVCSVGVGCSNAATIYVRGAGAPSVTVATGTNPIDVAAGSGNRAISLATRGITNSTPVLKIGSTSIWGNYDGGTARFVLPANLIATGNILSAFIEDQVTASDSDSFPIRVLNIPSPQLSAPITITQSLNANQNIQDASFVIPMAQMSFPTRVIWQDGASNTILNVPFDVLTNNAKITVPASLLKLGKYTANLRLSNVAGEVSVPVNVEIGKIIYTPIPRPVPNPIPNPIPRPPRFK